MSSTTDILVTSPSLASAVARKVVTGADPAANAEFSVTVPANKLYELLAVRVQLVQGLTQTPLPFLVIDDGTTTFAELPGSTTAQTASTTATYTWAPGQPTTGQLGATPTIRSLGALPSGLRLPAGYRVSSATQGLGANSNYGAPTLYVVEYSL